MRGDALSFKRNLLVYLPPLLHVFFCLVTALAQIPLGYLIVIDFPASLILAPIAMKAPGFITLIGFGIVGSIWWYVISRFIELQVNRVISRRRRDHDAGGPVADQR